MEPQRHLLWGPQGQQEWKRPVQKTSEDVRLSALLQCHIGLPPITSN
ncbi:rCG58194, isoform CRA_b [Rattus norvegicus]|uniref:RCG58194, isoform CRA_b n=1 Tax=Rattus norvegicus TaxID=10116 RepID=A6J4Y1_RAT|nr:rCG58194, isoform CRA_b [Rattus norvegicus]